MAIAAASPKLLGPIKRYIGYSTDVKSETSGGVNLPIGSTFFELDKQRTATFDGQRWVYGPPGNAIETKLDELLCLGQEIKVYLELLASKF